MTTDDTEQTEKITLDAEGDSVPRVVMPEESFDGFIILFHGTQDWEWCKGSEKEAIESATCSGRHLNYGRTGFACIWRNENPFSA